MYATLQDMLDRFEASELLQLTDADGVDDARLADRVAVQLADAKTVIDAHVAAKYQTGGDPVPPLLNRIACDLARFGLYRDAPPEAVQSRHDQARADLKAIAKGVIKLDSGREEIAPRPGAVLVDRPPRLFGRDSMKGF